MPIRSRSLAEGATCPLSSSRHKTGARRPDGRRSASIMEGEARPSRGERHAPWNAWRHSGATSSLTIHAAHTGFALQRGGMAAPCAADGKCGENSHFQRSPVIERPENCAIFLCETLDLPSIFTLPDFAGHPHTQGSPSNGGGEWPRHARPTGKRGGTSHFQRAPAFERPEICAIFKSFPFDFLRIFTLPIFDGHPHSTDFRWTPSRLKIIMKIQSTLYSQQSIALLYILIRIHRFAKQEYPKLQCPQQGREHHL